MSAESKALGALRGLLTAVVQRTGKVIAIVEPSRSEVFEAARFNAFVSRVSCLDSCVVDFRLLVNNLPRSKPSAA